MLTSGDAFFVALRRKNAPTARGPEPQSKPPPYSYRKNPTAQCGHTVWGIKKNSFLYAAYFKLLFLL